MTSREYEDHPLIIHHIHIYNREDRARAEACAVKQILNYYSRNIHKEFLYTESIFNTNGFAPLNSNRFPFDMDTCAFIAGNICASRKDIEYVAMGRTRTDIDSVSENFDDRMNRAQGIFKGVLSLEDSHPPTYIFPVVKWTKAEIWDSLPERIKQACWWCRRPNYNVELKAEPCGKCQTCREVRRFKHAGV